MVLTRRFQKFHSWERLKKVKVKSLSRVCLCDPMDCSPPGSSVPGILQASVLEWRPLPPPGRDETAVGSCLLSWGRWFHFGPVSFYAPFFSFLTFLLLLSLSLTLLFFFLNSSPLLIKLSTQLRDVIKILGVSTVLT